MREKEHLVKYKILYTLLVLLVYIVGKNIPLYMIDVSAYMEKSIDAESMIMQMVTGDIFQCSIFALGITPIMISGILVQIYSAIKKMITKRKMSPKKVGQLTVWVTLFFASAQAFIQVENLEFRVDGDMLQFAKAVAIVEMLTGEAILMWLISNVKKYGIAGQTGFIFLNILDGMILSLSAVEVNQLIVPLLISLIGAVLMLIMENSEMRIPVQRISIHNIFSDKNYMAIKLHPVGVMPAMFAVAFFTIPQLVVEFLIRIIPNNKNLLWWQKNLDLSKPVGLLIYILFIYALTISFSRLFINPKDITEQYLKGGDSLVDIHAGKDTRRYLSCVINVLSFFSATIMAVCLSVPIIMQNYAGMDRTVATIPSSVMILASIWCSIYREICAVRDLEAYEPFI